MRWLYPQACYPTSAAHQVGNTLLGNTMQQAHMRKGIVCSASSFQRLYPLSTRRLSGRLPLPDGQVVPQILE